MESILFSIMHAASWAFLHSLWMGLLLALIIAAIMYFIPHYKTSLRYRLSVGAIFIFFIANVLLFISHLNVKKESANLQDGASAVGSSNFVDEVTLGNSSIINIISTWVNQNFHIIFGIWFLVFFFKSIKLYQGVKWLKKVKKSGTVIECLEVLEKLKKRLNISKPITVIESIMIQVPAISGIFKPVLYLPLGFFNQMSIKDIEAVLLHELAHIKRYDYLVNILQSIIETIYFFNLPLLWASNLVKEEREYCCDDMALQIHRDKISFIQALLHFHEKSVMDKKLSLGFNGNRMPTLGRATRILNNKKIKLKAMDKMFIGTCFLVACFLGTTSMYFKNDAPNKMVAFANVKPDTLDPIQHILLDKKNNSTIKKKIESTLEENNITVEEYLKMEKLKQADVNSKIAKKLSSLEVLNSGLEPLNAMQELAIVAESKEMEEESRRMEIESKKMEGESRKMEAESKRMEIESRKMEEESKRMEVESMKMEKDSKNHSAVIDLLVKEGYIKEGVRFTLDLSKDALIIDGKAQSAELLNKCLGIVSKDFTRMTMNGVYRNNFEIKR